jgi:amidase
VERCATVDELFEMDATGLAALIEKRELKPIELVEATIERIEAINPKINAVVTPMYDQARDTAKKELPVGPFTGVPFLLKDLLAQYAGVRLTLGTRAMKDFVPSHDSELVIRFKRAGLIVVGKTNTSEIGLLPTTEPELFGPTRNPWGPGKSPGGSSGGSAAAVAARLVPMAHANDGGGSIRIPAACCGLFGLKPTRGRNPLGPDIGDIMSGLVVEHAVTRSVRDSARLLDAIQGPDPGAPYVAPRPWRPYAEEVLRDPRRLRIAFTTSSPTGTDVHPDCRAGVENAAKLLSELGHTVEEAAPKLDGPRLLKAFIDLWAAGTAHDVYRFRKMDRDIDQMEPYTLALAEQGRQLSAIDYLDSVSYLQGVGRDLARFMTTYDCWMTPTLGQPPLPLGSFSSSETDPLAPMLLSTEFVAFTPIANATGQPAMSMPLHRTEDNLPVGVHFLGRFGEEGLLFALAAQIERARPWSFDTVVS